MAGQNTDRAATCLTTDLTPAAICLLQASLSNSSRLAYRRSWHLFLEFQQSTIHLPAPITLLCNFIGELFLRGYSPASIASHVSAISYVHKLLNYHDNSHSFMVRKLLRGTQMNQAPDTQLPITKSILLRLLDAIQHTVPSFCDRIMLKALFLTAFHAFMRLGELVPRSGKESHKVLQRPDVSLSPNVSVSFTLRHFKTNKDSSPIVISIQANPASSACAVAALHEYMRVFTHTAGPLFQFQSSRPVTYAFVSHQLKLAIQFAGLNPAEYKGHSFRIGAATEAANLGFSEHAIQKMGRWNSDAVRRYVRLKSFEL